MEIANITSQEQRQEQRQQLSAKTLQSLELLHLPLQELETRLTRELEANPVLEETPPVDEAPPETPPEASETEDESRLDERNAEADEWNDELPLPDAASALSPGDGEYDRLGNSPAPPPPLAEQLEWELAAGDYRPRDRELARAVVSALDPDGYLATPLADLAMGSDADMDEMERALAIVQSFDPPGVGARDLAESLKLQLERRGALTPLLADILKNHLPDIERNKLPQVAKACGVSLDAVREALEILKTLNPTPAGALNRGDSGFIEPELEIYRDRSGEYKVRLLRERRRDVVISERYLKMLEDRTLDSATKSYLKEHIQRARELLQALDRRKSTLEKLGEVIVRTQRDFLDRGVKALHPLTMKQAGELMELDESVVSRAAADKLVVTPQGVFPCRFFFSSGFGNGGAEGEGQSSHAVTERIKEIVAGEDPARPLSDDAIAAILKDEGVAIARRTVAKYREAAHIPSSSLRRRH